MKFLTNLDLNKNQLQNAVIQPLATAPSNAVTGQVYYNTTNKLLYQYDGTAWKAIGVEYTLPTASATTLGGVKVGDGLSIADGVLSVDSIGWSDVQDKPTTLAGYGIVDAKIVNGVITLGSATATIPTKTSELTNDSDFATNTGMGTELAKKLDKSGGTMTGNINMNGNKITGLSAGSDNNDAVTYKQLTDAIEGIGTVFNLKGSKATVQDLPATGNKIGDVWYVASVSAGYIWIQDDQGTERWEQLGETIDLSGYLTKTGLLTSTGQATDNTMTQKAITDALGQKANTSAIPKATLKTVDTLATSATTKTISVTNGYILNTEVFDSVTKEKVICEITYGNGTTTANNSVTVTTAAKPTNALNIIVTYLAL